MIIADAMQIILEANSRDIVMKDLGVSSPLISSWKSSENKRIPRFEVAVKIYGIYGLIIYPYDEEALKDNWLEMEDLI